MCAEDGTFEQRYLSTGGTVTVTRSRSNRIEGHFEFEAVLWPELVFYVRDIDPNGPRVRVQGSFGANPARIRGNVN